MYFRTYAETSEDSCVNPRMYFEVNCYFSLREATVSVYFVTTIFQRIVFGPFLTERVQQKSLSMMQMKGLERLLVSAIYFLLNCQLSTRGYLLVLSVTHTNFCHYVNCIQFVTTKKNF